MSVDKDTAKGISHDHRKRRLDREMAYLEGKGLTNAQVAELISDDLREMFWRRKLDIYFAQELGE